MGSTIPIWRKPHFLSYWGPPILWGLAVLGMAGNVGSGRNTYFLLQWLVSWFVVPNPAQLIPFNFYMRKVGHVLSYGWMYFLWFRAFRQHGEYGPGQAFIWSLGFSLLFASMDEGCQWFYQTRGASIYDVCLDLLGASLAALITAALWRPRERAAPMPLVSWWQKPHVLYYWLPPVLWSLAVLAAPRWLVPVEITLGPLKWLVSWFALVNSYDLQILNLYLWKIAQVLTFGILYVLWFRGFQGYAGAGRGWACLYALGLCLLAAMMHKGLLTLAQTRGGSMYEVILDVSGAALAALVTAALWRPRRPALTPAGTPGRQIRGPE